MEPPHRRSAREFLARPPFSKRGIPDEHMGLFCTALTHDSYSSENGNEDSYERLEFLGDAVIELIVREHIFRNTGGSEGNMTQMKQEIVANRKMSSRILEKGLDIDSVMRVGHGHIDPVTKENTLEENMRADCFEALMGAFYIVYGMDECRSVVNAVLL